MEESLPSPQGDALFTSKERPLQIEERPLSYTEILITKNK